jgi:hypothetical protein
MRNVLPIAVSDCGSPGMSPMMRPHLQTWTTVNKPVSGRAHACWSEQGPTAARAKRSTFLQRAVSQSARSLGTRRGGQKNGTRPAGGAADRQTGQTWHPAMSEDLAEAYTSCDGLRASASPAVCWSFKHRTCSARGDAPCRPGRPIRPAKRPRRTRKPPGYWVEGSSRARKSPTHGRVRAARCGDSAALARAHRSGLGTGRGAARHGLEHAACAWLRVMV